MNYLLRFRAVLFAPVLICVISVVSFAQKPVEMPVVTKVDDVTIKALFKPNGKPLLINFWATWCVPCVEEFPVLVALDKEYKGRADIITISIDDLAEIKRDVPKFLFSQNATMPAYLLHTRDENKVIGEISNKFGGGLPFTILFSTDGSTIYEKQGILKADEIKPIIDAAIVVEECKPGELDN